jgi:hypothetical protein
MTLINRTVFLDDGMRIPGHSATRFRLKAPPDSVSFRHPNPVEAAT